MKTKIYPSLILLILVMSSCAPSGYLVSEKGDLTKISLMKNRVIKGELLAVYDTMILVLQDNNILAIKNSKLNEIDFDKYSDYSWIAGVALLQVLPSAVFSALGAGYGNDFATTFAVTLIPAVISASLFALSSPETTFDNFTEISELHKLKKFCRYPGGITERQLKELLKSYGQDSCIYLK